MCFVLKPSAAQRWPHYIIIYYSDRHNAVVPFYYFFCSGNTRAAATIGDWLLCSKTNSTNSGENPEKACRVRLHKEHVRRSILSQKH